MNEQPILYTAQDRITLNRPQRLNAFSDAMLRETGELLDAQEALKIGYVSRVVLHDSLMAETMAFAKRLADGPPIALQLAKRLVYRSLSTTFMEGLEAAQAAMTIAQSTEDAREGPPAFREKRSPRFRGR